MADAILVSDPATRYRELINELYHPGFLQATASSSTPAGWLLCDGAAVSRTAYARLFTAIGTTYGAGNGTTTFNVPDFRGRVLVGEDGSAGRLTANDALGQSGGAEKHTLTVGELPAHSHEASLGTGIGTEPDQVAPGNSDTSLGSATTGTTGSGTAHNNMQPYQVVNWLIKV